ncbi:MAG: ABC transporter ATP-binding protein [Clostridia bacterium]|nr:ABC transporter ATP-binding protein [Clostridia bacterium]
MALLEVQNLEVNYGLIKAIKGISFEVNQGEIVSLIGANGAGKTTTLHAISNILPKSGGKVFFDGEDITDKKAHELVYMGIAHVPEGRRIFSELTVYENIQLGFFSRKDKREYEQSLQMVYEYFPVLQERQNQIAGTLSGGEQQMLAMSRALMSKPKLLLMDEPSMGLSPLYVNTIFEIVQKVNRESGTTVLLVEQNAKKALSISSRAYVLEIGNISLTGTGSELLNNKSVIEAYLGGE